MSFPSSVLVLLLVFAITDGVYSELLFQTPAGVMLDSTVSVGTASDVLIEVYCVSSSSTDQPVWNGSDSLVSSPISTFGISQDYDDDGGGGNRTLLRIYPAAAFLSSKELFICSSNGDTRTITFDNAGSIFFDAIDSSLNCSLPMLPASMILMNQTLQINGVSYNYCNASSDRGSFISDLIATESEEPVFIIQPLNVTVPINTSTAFSCSVTPDSALSNVSWYFNDGLVPDDDNDIMSDLPHVGTSILTRYNVTSSDAGDYYCRAFFSNRRQPLTSNTARLDINDISPVSQFLLTPPSSLTVLVNTNVSLPCVSNNSNGVSWNRTTSANIMTDDMALSIININPDNAGVYTCTSGRENSTVNITVLYPPQFLTVPDNETIVSINDNVKMTCVARGNPTPSIYWYINGTNRTMMMSSESVTDGLTTTSNITLNNVQPNSTGIYQCVAVGGVVSGVGVASFNGITSSTYLLVRYIQDIFIDQSFTDPVNPLMPEILTLTCTVNSQPLTNITWDVGNVPVTIRQSPVGFRGPSLSSLSVNSSLLSGSVSFSCRGNDTVNETTVINAFSPVTIEQNPVSPPVLILRNNVSFSCSASSIPIPVINWFRNASNGSVSITDDITATNISDTAVNSTLTINITSEDQFGDYFCVASNGFFNATSTVAVVIRGVRAVITVGPVTVPVVKGDNISINCTAEGLPSPTINWFINTTNAISLAGFDVKPSNITDNQTLSVLTGIISNNNTVIQCKASNRFNSVTSEVNQLISGPPLSPGNLRNISLSRSVLVSWDRPFSLLPITTYNVTITNSTFFITNVSTTDTSINITKNIMPFNNYTVSVSATNRAGTGSALNGSFQSLQDVPTGSPNVTMTTSISNETILVEWDEIDERERNGPITNYTVWYNGTNVTATSQQVNITGLSGGTLYSISVAGNTIIGRGPFSSSVTQTTISNPPPITNESVTIPAGQSVTTNTIPIDIPSRLNSDSVLIIWVVVIRLDDTLQDRLFPSSGSSPSPDHFYASNRSFIIAGRDPVVAGRPYIAGELLISSLTFPYTFTIGSGSATGGYNNPPLASGTSYTFFIRAFPPAALPDDGRVKRQSVIPQYNVFSSTQFSSPQRTQSETTNEPSTGLSAGAIAGIVISLVVVILLLITVLIFGFFVFIRPRAVSDFIPPPGDRKGSMRLTESQKLLHVTTSGSSTKSHEVSMINNINKRSVDIPELTPTDQRQPISILLFPDYVKRLHANTDHLFSEEYELITIKSPSLPHEASQLPCNVDKNRYGNINSFDETRVKLTAIPGIEGSDYINANYIDGYGSRDTYIGCQGPLAETTQDFWRMIWEQKSSCIVMLTNCVEKGRPKCHQYWPQSGSSTFGALTITIIDQQVLAYYTIRTFKITNNDESFEVKQFHYTAWPDFGVPDHPNPIISFIRRINNYNHNGPIVVHCSAGVGRSGTFITIQSMMMMIKSEGKVDVFNFVLDMRHKRNYMVQTEAQYMFVHDSLVEFFKVGDTELSVQSFPKEYKVLTTAEDDEETTPLHKQFNKLNSIDVAVPSQYISASLPVNRSKNRYPDILPYESYRVRLLMLPGVSGSDYINASYVDGYLRCNQFIMTQGPLTNTVDDFWRMVWEHRASAIVMLCSLVEDGKDQSVQYWPNDQLTQYGDMFIETLNETETGFYKIRELQMTHTKQGNEVRQIKQFHYTDWSEDKTPPTTGPLMDMIMLVQKAHHLFGGGPVVVHDSSSIGRSGTFCIINIVIERLKVEGMIDIFFTIHALRRKHPGIVANYDQFQFCYKTILEYLNSFDKYANFD